MQASAIPEAWQRPRPVVFRCNQLPYYRINRKVCQLFFRILPAASHFLQFCRIFPFIFCWIFRYTASTCLRIAHKSNFFVHLFSRRSQTCSSDSAARGVPLTPVNVRRHRQLPLLQPLFTPSRINAYSNANTGQPSSMPMGPNSPPATRTEIITQRLASPVDSPKIFGVRILPSSCCRTRIKIMNSRLFDRIDQENQDRVGNRAQ